MSCASNFAKSYRQCTEDWERILACRRNSTEVDMIISIDATTGKGPVGQQRLVSITFNKCGHTGHYRNNCTYSTGISLAPDQTPMHSPPTIVTHMVTASYAMSQSSWVTILKELTKVKKMNQQ